MNTKVRKFEDVIGQTSNKYIIQGLLREHRVPDVMWLKGASGSGKSTFAELIALADTCESTDSSKPCLKCPTCLENLSALDSQHSKSRYIKKINMAELTNKKDIKELIETVFDLEPIPGKDTYYIFEELQELRDYQNMFLERLRDLPEGVHIIGCTTDFHTLSTPFATRARISLQFNKLDTSECLTLVNRLIYHLNLTGLSETDKHLVIAQSKHNARIITNTLNTFKTFPNISLVLRQYFNIIPMEYYLFIMEALAKDFTSFIIDVDELTTKVDMIDFYRNFKNFLIEAIFYFYCKKVTLLTKTEKSKVNMIFSQFSQATVKKLLATVSTSCRTTEDVVGVLIKMHSVVEDTPLTVSKMKQDAKIEESIANELTIKKEIEESRKVPEVTKLTLDKLTNEAKTSEGMLVKTNIWVD